MSPADSQTTRVIRKGEHLFQAGDACKQLVLIQSGVVSIYLPKGKQKLELCQVRAPQSLGYECLLGIPTHATSAIVLSDVKALIVPLKQAQALYQDGPQLMKLLLKNGFEREKLILQELRSLKAGSDTSPCPTDIVTKLFGAIYHSARYKGVEQDGKVTLSWDLLRQYVQRVFLEPPIRLENACNILVKLGLATYKKVPDETDPEAPPKIGEVTFSDLPFIEGFFEYYAHHFFKGSNTTVLKTDERCLKFLKVALDNTKDAKMDRGGVVHANLVETMEKINAAMGTQNTDYFTLIEAKGLFAKKSPSNSGGLFQYHRAEWESTLRYWGLLREIEKWNELGMVDPDAADETAAANGAAGGDICPSCEKKCDTSSNFCPGCGHKLKAAA